MKRPDPYTLSEEVFDYKGRACKVFFPPLRLGEVRYYWIKFITGDCEVKIVEVQYLDIDKMGKVLYGD